MDGSPPANLTPAARTAYDRLVEAPSSPVWTHPREDLLGRADRAAVAAFAERVVLQPPAWAAGGEPAWVAGWLAATWRRVPALTALGPAPARLLDAPLTSRDDLETDVTRWVPLDADLNALIAYTTSGTSGPTITVPSHPITTASYIPLILHAARPAAVPRLRRDALDWVTLTSQAVGGYIVPSYSSVSGVLTAQIPVGGHGWTGAAGCAAFLAEHDPAVLTSDPVAFDELLRLSPAIRPQLLVSTATSLSEGLRHRLESSFDAPVVDVYSLTESGPVAAATAAGEPHHLLQPDLFVEVVRPDGSRCDPGERGEIVLTGGMNPSLPLLRYRTGDHAALEWRAEAAAPVLVDLEGRAPVVLRGEGGRRVNSHSITVALRPVALGRVAVHQHGDDRVSVGVDRPASQDAQQVPALLKSVLGASISVEVVGLDVVDKAIPFVVDPPT